MHEAPEALFSTALFSKHSSHPTCLSAQLAFTPQHYSPITADKTIVHAHMMQEDANTESGLNNSDIGLNSAIEPTDPPTYDDLMALTKVCLQLCKLACSNTHCHMLILQVILAWCLTVPMQTNCV